MSVRVIRPGLFTTVQDAGRFGWQSQGIGPGGAMDLEAMRLANALVGNDESAAVLETTLLGPVLHFDDDAMFALSGAPADARVDSTPMPHRRAVFVPAGTTVTIGPCTSGCRTTVAFAGGVAVAPVLGSRSTNVRAHFGGFEGRALAANDCLPLGALSTDASRLFARLRGIGRSWAADSDGCGDDLAPVMGGDVRVRAIPASGLDRLDAASRAALFTVPFSVGQKSDRMGYRLEGPPLVVVERREMISAGVAWGAVQLPPDGYPIVLGADRPTTGGYPVIAHVASVDRRVLAQLRPGDRLQFTAIDLASAEEAWVTSERRWVEAIETLRERRRQSRP